MLESLQNSSQKEALGALSQLATSLAPRPLVEGEERGGRAFNFYSEDVLTEIRNRVGLAADDFSDNARDKITSFIADQISEMVLAQVDEKAIKARLAQKHLLRPDLYDLEFTDSFSAALDRGFKESHVRQTLNYPDETFTVPLFDSTRLKETGAVWLFVKHRAEKIPANNFSFLVVTWQKGYMQRIFDAIRVYPSDVDLSRVRTPLELLRAFVDKYGFFAEIGTRRDKFFFMQSIPKPTVVFQNRLPGFHPVYVDAPVGTEMFYPSLIDTTNTAYEVALAYAINEGVYREDLRKHGVKAARKPSIPPQGQRSKLY